ncbi:MAG: TetR/AcrR family transcriptional regulator [Rhodothermaceae bacterium]
MRLKEGNKEKDIIESAIKIFAEKGFHNSKISDIAKEANVATGSVYRYFKNKEDIIVNIFDDLWEKLFAEIKVMTKNKKLSPTETIDTIIDLIFDLFADNPSLAVVFVNEQNNLILSKENKFAVYYNKFLDLGVAALEQGQKESIISPSIDPHIFRHFVFGAVRNLIHMWAQDQETYPLIKIRTNIKFLIKNGIKEK